MKQLLVIALAFSSTICLSQKIDKGTIGKEGIQYMIKGLIEIDGHLIKNDTCKMPVKYIIDLRGSTITNGNKIYYYRECSKDKCDIIHLEQHLSGTLYFGNSGLTN